jgi:sortase B
MENNHRSAPKKKQSAKVLYWVTVGFLITVIIACAVMIGYKLVTDAADRGEYDELAALKESAGANATRPPIPTGTTAPDPTGDTEATEPEGTTQPTEPPVLDDTILLEYQAMYNLNNDMVGWIEIPGTTINYPVVHTPDSPNFYLRRNFYKEKATCGTIYVREACDVNLPSDNITVYGHNMRNGTMFADLHKYKDPSYWADHRYVYFDTLTEYHTYEIFSVFVTTADLTKGFTYHIYDTFPMEADFNKYVSTCKNMDLYETGVKPVYGEKLLTLSTCDKTVEDGRLVVVARRVL